MLLRKLFEIWDNVIAQSKKNECDLVIMLSCIYIQNLGQKADINLSSAHNKWDAMGLRLNLETYFQ